ncbi:carbon-nitrogen family hydrolase [Paenibacillus albicereus]|uniref:Carbon-nitrogen family hydrolase n=1 Tax=Paenibacillus albicereus TaxID=2726185 RepID=A0A6H2GWX8_9BACL|nr:carbon-nitrogen family hydrolase [Paenibacillus albicereus]QJC51933.1 carbon-nitrogen family hydrolase [Paenibacillus albicereus]
MSGNGGKLRISALQLHIDAGEPELNFARVRSRLQEAAAAADKPDVIVLPEMWNTGYALDRIGELADPDGERTRAMLSAFSREAGVHVVGGSIAEKRAQEVYNAAYAFNREGELAGQYEKMHLFRLMEEEKHLAAGSRLGLFPLEGADAAMMICYDIRFPELARSLALAGAKALFVPAEWPKPRLHHWRSLLIARAIENQMYVIACNRTGTSGETEFFGHSMIVDPWGEVLAEAGEEETILSADIDLALVDEVRARIPVFEDRRPQLYRL